MVVEIGVTSDVCVRFNSYEKETPINFKKEKKTQKNVGTRLYYNGGWFFSVL